MLLKCQLAFLIINFFLNVISNCSCSTKECNAGFRQERPGLVSQLAGEKHHHPAHPTPPRPAAMPDPAPLREAASLAPNKLGRQTAASRDKAGLMLPVNGLADRKKPAHAISNMVQH